MCRQQQLLTGRTCLPTTSGVFVEEELLPPTAGEGRERLAKYGGRGTPAKHGWLWPPRAGQTWWKSSMAGQTTAGQTTAGQTWLATNGWRGPPTAGQRQQRCHLHSASATIGTVIPITPKTHPSRVLYNSLPIMPSSHGCQHLPDDAASDDAASDDASTSSPQQLIGISSSWP